VVVIRVQRPPLQLPNQQPQLQLLSQLLDPLQPLLPAQELSRSTVNVVEPVGLVEQFVFRRLFARRPMTITANVCKI